MNLISTRSALLAGIVLVCATGGARAATYYVAINGDDANPGTAAQPWRTVQKAANVMVAGDNVLISPGNYAESVTTRAHGSSGARIRFQANPPNVPTSQIILKQFRVQHRFNVIEGFNLTGGQDLNTVTIRLEYNPPIDSSHTIITNNTLRDGVYLMADDLHFDPSNNGITTQKGNWLASGFEPGGYVFLGSNSKNPYANHDTPWRVKAVTANTIYLTNNAGTRFLSEPVPYVWGVVYAGSGNNAYPGIDTIPGPGISAATNCTIVNNTFSNLFGCPIKFSGANHLVEGNFITRVHGYYAIQPQGNNQIIRNNVIKDCTNFIFFTQHEILNIPHPPGGNFFDYQVALISSFVTYSTNILFERNWIQNAHNQMGFVSHNTGTWGFTIRSNMFIGVQSLMSGSRNNLTIEHNTYYRCAFDEGRSHVLGLGGTFGNLQRNLILRKNLFIDCGSHYSFDYEGYYFITDSTDYIADYNFVCGSETMGYGSKRYFAEPHGVNGGDPVLTDPANPLGPDGLPFTEDDGMRPLANSPFASGGWGALPPRGPSGGAPIAHFRVTSPVGWFDLTGTNYNPAWVTMQPYQRGDVMRPYHTSEVLGTNPVAVVFDAGNSIAGVIDGSASNLGIASYHWDFGDGNSETVAVPTVSHVYTQAGNFTVTLQVANTLGNTASIQRKYRVRYTPAPKPLPPRNFRVVVTSP
jgi:hypothetical protein